MNLAGTISGMNSSALLTSLFASIILHAAILMSIPTPRGESGTGPAESDSALNVTVERTRLADTPSPEQSQQLSTGRLPTPQPVQETMVETEDPTPVPDTPPPVPERSRVEPEPEMVQVIVAKPSIEAKPKPVPNSDARIVTAKMLVEATDSISENQPPPARPQIKPEPKPVSAVPSTPAPSANVKGARTTVIKPLQTASTGKTRSLVRDYRSTLLRLIHRNKYYPLQARRRGLQGKVLVAFTVVGNGKIKNITLSRSSGKKLLDRAAIQTIKRMGKAPPFPQEIKRRNWRFVVPISYNIS